MLLERLHWELGGTGLEEEEDGVGGSMKGGGGKPLKMGEEGEGEGAIRSHLAFYHGCVWCCVV